MMIHSLAVVNQQRFKNSSGFAWEFLPSPLRSTGKRSRHWVEAGCQVAWTSPVGSSQVPEEIEEWGVIPLANRITKDQTPGPSLIKILRPLLALLCCRWEMLMFAKRHVDVFWGSMLCWQSLIFLMKSWLFGWWLVMDLPSFVKTVKRR